MNIYLSSILGVLLISIIPLIGLVALVVKRKELDRKVHLLVSFAVGALLGNSIIHILPELFESGMNTKHISIFIILGIVLFYVLEQFLRWRHCHEQSSVNHTHPVGVMNQIGDTVHNFIDGILIASSFVVDINLGWATIIAVILHEIPQEIADFGALLYAKWSVKRILFANILSASFAFLGLALGFWINSHFLIFSNYALAITVGGFLYIACTDLLPDLHEKGASTAKERLLQLVVMFIGILMFLIF